MAARVAERLAEVLRPAPCERECRARAFSLSSPLFSRASTQCCTAMQHAALTLPSAQQSPLSARQVCFVSLRCGLHTLGYHMLIPLEDNAYGMQHVAARLGFGPTPPANAHDIMFFVVIAGDAKWTTAQTLPPRIFEFSISSPRRTRIRWWLWCT